MALVLHGHGFFFHGRCLFFMDMLCLHGHGLFFMDMGCSSWTWLVLHGHGLVRPDKGVYVMEKRVYVMDNGRVPHHSAGSS